MNQIYLENVKSNSDGAFCSYDLYTFGSSLEELLANASYSLIDQDGGEVRQVEADDDLAEKLIREEFETLVENFTRIYHDKF